MAVPAVAQAQPKEVIIGYQDMVLPWRYVQETQELEKRTGYKVTYRQIGSGAEIVQALASGAIHIGEAGSSPLAATANFLKEQRIIQQVLPDYSVGVNPRWVELGTR